MSFPVRILENKQKLGYRRNFLHVAKACYGEAVAFCDQDDIWHNDKLERAGKALRHKDVLLFHHEAETFSDKENINTKKIQKISDNRRIVSPMTSHAWQHPLGFTMVVDIDLIKYCDLCEKTIDYKYKDEIEAHDQFFFFLASSLGVVIYDNTVLAKYRQHDRNVFGFGKRNSFIKRAIDDNIQNYFKYYKHLSLCSKKRSEVLSSINKTKNIYDRNVIKSLSMWRSLSDAYNKRSDLYGKNILNRFFFFFYLIMNGFYSNSGEWTFGKKAFFRDFILGCLFSALVRNINTETVIVDWSCRPGRNEIRSRLRAC